MVTVKYNETAHGDCYASIYLDGELVLQTLFMGESERELLDMAAKHVMRAGN